MEPVKRPQEKRTGIIRRYRSDAFRLISIIEEYCFRTGEPLGQDELVMCIVDNLGENLGLTYDSEIEQIISKLPEEVRQYARFFKKSTLEKRYN